MKIIDSWLVLNKRGITYSVFGVLFVIRLISGYLLATHQSDIPPSYSNLFFTVSLMLFTIFIVANKDELDEFNIDKYVIYTFILTDIMLFLSYGLSIPGGVAIICSIATGKALFNSKTELNRKGNFFYIILFISIGILPELLLKLLLADSFQGYKFFSGLSIGTIFAINSVTLWNVMFEELLFRSILWKILNDWKFSTNKVILTQAFLFWLVHFGFITDKSLGFPILLFGIWVGFLTLRSKSLTPSIATHFFHNITSRLL